MIYIAFAGRKENAIYASESVFLLQKGPSILLYIKYFIYCVNKKKSETHVNMKKKLSTTSLLVDLQFIFLLPRTVTGENRYGNARSACVERSAIEKKYYYLVICVATRNVSTINKILNG